MDVVLALFYFQKTMKERLMSRKQKEDAMIAERMQQLNLSEAVREALQPVIDSDISQIKNWEQEQIDKAIKSYFDRESIDMEKSATEFKTIFAEADADGDKLLNLAEYLTFCAKYKEVREKRGETFATRTDDQHRVMYEAVKSINPNTDGASSLDVAAAHIYYANVIKEQLDPYYIPPLVQQAFAPIIEKDIAKMQAWNDDQKGLAWEFAESRRHGVEKQKSDEEFAQFFARCDKSKDGLLHLEEYLAYAELYSVTKDQRGEPDTPKT